VTTAANPPEILDNEASIANGLDGRRSPETPPAPLRPSTELLTLLSGTNAAAEPTTDSSSDASSLNLLIDAQSIAKLAAAMDAAHVQFGKSKSNLESQVVEHSQREERVSRRLELIIDSISDCLITVSPQGQIESINRAARELFETTEEEALGKSVGSLLKTGDGLHIDYSKPVEHDVRLASGTQLRVELNARHIDSGNDPASLLRIKDLTTVRHTQKRLSEYAFLVENVQAFVLVTNRAASIEWCNPHFEATTGYKRNELQGRQVRDLIVDDGNAKEALTKLNEATANNESYSVDLLLRHKTGRLIWTQLEGHPMFSDDGEFEKFITLGIDITERKLREQMQVNFCSMVSHELRTPLTVVSGSLDALSTGLAGSMSKMANELLDMGRRNCTQLSVLIEDILDINKLESGLASFESELINISEPLQAAVSSAIPLSNSAGITLNYDERPISALAFTDPQRLRQVFTNLLSNAIKFSPIGSSIDVGIEQRDDSLRAYVRDEGPGIPLEFRPHIFEKFSRDAAVQASGKEGFGLGLCISKSLVERMGGTISYESVVGTGTTFFVDLPVSANETTSSLALSSAVSDENTEL